MDSILGRSISDKIDTGSTRRKVIVTSCCYVISTVIYGVCLQEVYAHSRDLKPLHRGFEVPIILTAVDIATLFILLKFKSPECSKRLIEGTIVTFISHIACEYLLHYWYAFSRVKSFTVGYVEPILFTGLLKICTGSDVTTKLFIIIVSIVICAELTSGEVLDFLGSDRAGIIILLVILFVCLRNISLKLLQEESVNISPRTSIVIPYAAIFLSVGSVLSAFHLTSWALPVMFALVAMFASVGMFYFSVQLLEHTHVTAVSVVGALSQVCVNFACMPAEHAQNAAVSIAALMFLFFGVLMYFRLAHKVESPAEMEFKMSHHEMYTRMEFVLFMGVVSGLIFYVLRPTLSSRDLNNLHYVGLDKIVKALLRHKQ